MVDEQRARAVTDRFVEKFEIQVERLSYLGHELNEPRILEVYHELWMMTRVLKCDPDISVEDVT